MGGLESTVSGAFSSIGNSLGINGGSIGGILDTFDGNIDPLIKLVSVVALLIGILLMIHAVRKLIGLRQAGGHDQQASMSGIITMAVVAVILINLPGAMNIIKESLSVTNVTPLSNISKVGDLGTKGVNIAKVIMHFIEFVGIISFIKGFLVLNKVANGGSQDATIGKGITHIVGGIFAANIVWFSNIISTSFGLNFGVS